MVAPTAWISAIVTLMLVPACASESRGSENLIDLGVCDPSTGTFTTEIDNPYLPLPVGQRNELQGNGFLVRVSVLDEVEIVAGVATRVVEEYEAIGGHVVEISRNYFAQAQEGTVCYFGEDVDIYDENGAITSHAGAWSADGQGNVPGIFMPSRPRVGQAFQQELAPGVAEDQAEVVALGERTEVPAGTFEDTVTMVDYNPLDGTRDTKVYARGVGLIVDEEAELTGFVSTA